MGNGRHQMRSDRLDVSQRTCTETGHTPQPLQQLAVSRCDVAAAAVTVHNEIQTYESSLSEVTELGYMTVWFSF